MGKEYIEGKLNEAKETLLQIQTNRVVALKDLESQLKAKIKNYEEILVDLKKITQIDIKGVFNISDANDIINGLEKSTGQNFVRELTWIGEDECVLKLRGI